MADKTNQKKTIPSEETALFCDQVAMILRGGIPIRSGIETLCNNYKDTVYSSRFTLINNAVQEGGSLYEGIRRAGFFPKYMVNMVKIGEATGTLDEVMESLARYYYRDAEIRSSVTNAVLYPSILTMMMGLVIAVLIIGVMPVFERVFTSLGAAGAATSAASVGSTVGKFVLLAVALLLFLIVLFALLLKTRRRGGVMNFLMAIFSPLRRVVESTSAARFAAISETVLKTGYDLDATVDFAEGVITDKNSIACLGKLRTALSNGTPFARAVANTGIFEPLHSKMIEMGSSVGQLDVVMHNLNQMYEEKTDTGVNRLVSLIEPVLVAFLSLVVGGILLMVMLPLIGILTSMV